MTAPSFLPTSRGYQLAYRLTPPKQPNAPYVVFCGGFKSDMTGTKATTLEEACQRAGLGYIRFDYSGHGQSGCDFVDCTLSQWLADTADIIALTGDAPLVLVGSSMGGWVALRLLIGSTETIKNRIRAFVGIAAAPDFTRDLMIPSFTPAQLNELARTDRIIVPSVYEPDTDLILTRALLDDGDINCLLDQTWDSTVPMTLLQGRLDTDVPWHWPQRIAQAFPKANITLHLIADGDHRLSQPEQLGLLGAVVTSCAYI